MDPQAAHVPPTRSAEMLLVHDCFFRDFCPAKPRGASGRIRMPVDAMDECLILDWLTLELNLTLHLAARINVQWTGDDGARRLALVLVYFSSYM